MRRREGSVLSSEVNWRFLRASLVVMFLGPTACGYAWVWVLESYGAANPPLWMVYLAVFGGLALFLLGWLLVGASLRPGRSAWRGITYAAVLYTLVGLAFLALVPDRYPGTRVADGVPALVSPFVWPLDVAQMRRWFGYGYYYDL
jgi:hypothetical protein